DHRYRLSVQRRTEVHPARTDRVRRRQRDASLRPLGRLQTGDSMQTKLALAFSLFVVSAAVLIAQGGMRPGRWETTMQMEMAGSPVQMPAMKQTRCITQDEAKDPSSLSSPPGGRGGKSDCKMSDQKMSGNTMSSKMTCSSPEAMTGTGEMTFGDDSYTGIMRMNMAQGAMSMK